MGVVEYKLYIGRAAEVGAVKPSDGASLAKRTFVSDQSLSQAVIGTCNHVENALLGPPNYLRIIQRAVVRCCRWACKRTDGWGIDPVLAIIQEVGE